MRVLAATDFRDWKAIREWVTGIGEALCRSAPAAAGGTSNGLNP
ncbi:MAG TPA: hypothetical protein VHH34_19130 [Pseudonocardiaceae bacterium]|nr:hypothetical protein [Pseudonocardiaceae bacterium]